MFSARRTQPTIGDVLNGVQNLDLPALMRLEIAATMASQRLRSAAAAAAATIAEEGGGGGHTRNWGSGSTSARRSSPSRRSPRATRSRRSTRSRPGRGRGPPPPVHPPPRAGSASMDTTAASVYLDAEDLSAMVDASANAAPQRDRRGDEQRRRGRCADGVCLPDRRARARRARREHAAVVRVDLAAAVRAVPCGGGSAFGQHDELGGHGRAVPQLGYVLNVHYYRVNTHSYFELYFVLLFKLHTVRIR